MKIINVCLFCALLSYTNKQVSAYNYTDYQNRKQIKKKKKNINERKIMHVCCVFRSYTNKQVSADKVYTDYQKQRSQTRLNGTRWETFDDFIIYLGEEGICEIEESPEGLSMSVYLCLFMLFVFDCLCLFMFIFLPFSRLFVCLFICVYFLFIYLFFFLFSLFRFWALVCIVQR
jgi:hypothetical protein